LIEFAIGVDIFEGVFMTPQIANESISQLLKENGISVNFAKESLVPHRLASHRLYPVQIRQYFVKAGTN
jgi:hypothetical protein